MSWLRPWILSTFSYGKMADWQAPYLVEIPSTLWGYRGLKDPNLTKL